MARSSITVTLKVRRAWWLTPYFHLVAALAAITGREPDYERVQYWISKGLTVQVIV